MKHTIFTLFVCWLCIHLPLNRLRLTWHGLWIRQDEFHPSLNIDVKAVSAMDTKRLGQYYKTLIDRRDIAHKRHSKRV